MRRRSSPGLKAGDYRAKDGLKSRGYAGAVCLTAEYSDENAVDSLVVEDLAFARSLFQ